MTARTGVTREARTLSGRDVGKLVWIECEWRVIFRIIHYDNRTIIEYHLNLDAGTTYQAHLAPTDTVTIRGRDE